MLLWDPLAQTGFASATDRGARTSIVEAVASDGCRAVSRWGELFNSAVDEQAVVITVNDRPSAAVVPGNGRGEVRAKATREGAASCPDPAPVRRWGRWG